MTLLPTWSILLETVPSGLGIAGPMGAGTAKGPRPIACEATGGAPA